MSILNRIIINHLRNLDSVDINLSSKINVFYGVNGSGKTSVLESISLLGLGRSFRSHKTRSLIKHSHTGLTVFAEIVSENNVIPVGVQKASNGQSSIKVSGDPVHSAAQLAKQLPLLIINAHSFQLIEGSPAQRRQFLDWLVFHVKPEFANLWKKLQNTLKQRNSLLRRDKISYSDIHPWDIELARLAETIDSIRQEVFALLVEKLLKINKQSRSYNESQDLQVDIVYNRGWDKDIPFADILKSDFERDAKDGYTHHGPQRAELKIKVNNKAAADVLSRGQEKSLICAMIIAQAQIYRDQRGQTPVFLVDDLTAELDEAHSLELTQSLYALGGQVFVTGVYLEQLLSVWSPHIKEGAADISLFHVEQGEINETSRLALSATTNDAE